MVGKERAELKNKVLEFLIPLKGSYQNDYIFSSMGNPVNSQDHFDEILDEMIFDGSKYLEFMKDGSVFFLKSNNFTKEFLDNGGFVNMYESDLEADLQAFSITKQEQTIRNLTEQNLTLSNQVAAIKLKTHLIPLIISGISAVVAIGSLAYAINSESNSVSQSELKTIQNNIDSLRSDFKKENDKLKQDLYKAELWIAVLEEESFKE